MRLAIFCYFEGNAVPSIRDMIEYLQQNLTWDVDVYNLMDYRTNSYEIVMPGDFNLGDYDGCLIHNSLAYDPNNVVTLFRDNVIGLKKFSGIKIIFKQDENFKFKETDDLIVSHGFDCVFTCLPESEVKKIYPKSLSQGIIFHQMYTGYVTPSLLAFAEKYRTANRDIDIFYRGSIQPPEFGKLAVDKHRIGTNVAAKLEKNKNINLDISSFSSDRLVGEDWFRTLSRSRATLGLESGASVFDTDEEIPDILADAEKLVSQNSEKENFVLSRIAHIEGNINYAQIAPRHFEAAAMQSIQILYPGQYSGLLKKNIHYLELRENLSNLNSIISKIKNKDLCKKMANRAFKDIVMNPDLHVDRLVEKVEAVLKKSVQGIKYDFELVKRSNIGLGNFGFILCNHKPSADPRLSYMSRYSQSTMPILGLVPANEQSEAKMDDGVMELSCPRQIVDRGFLFSLIDCIPSIDDDKVVIESVINRLIAVTYSDKNHEHSYRYSPQFENLNPERKNTFQWYSNHMLEATSTFLHELMNWKNLDFIVCADLPTLLAGVIFSKIKKIDLFYDAHEWWPFIESGVTNYEQEFWLDVEKKLVKMSNLNVTVNPILAKKMGDKYGVDFLSVCNCSPLVIDKKDQKKNKKKVIKTTKNKKKVRYIFQGGISEGRGLDELIDIWRDVEGHLELFIRGPEGDEKDKLKAQVSALGNKNIIFLDSVSEDQLIESLDGFDVGIIPYGPRVLNQKYCCPNKMSQYMAAGLPILANFTEFVGPFIRDHNIGCAVNFDDVPAVRNAITLLAKPQSRKKFSRGAKDKFEMNYNWQSESQKLTDRFSLVPQSSKYIPMRTGVRPENLMNYFSGDINKMRPVFPINILASDNISDVTSDYKYLAHPQNITDLQRFKYTLSAPTEEIRLDFILSETERANRLVFDFESISKMSRRIRVLYRNDQSNVQIDNSTLSSNLIIPLDVSIKGKFTVILSDFNSEKLVLNSIKIYGDERGDFDDIKSLEAVIANEDSVSISSLELAAESGADILILPKPLMPLKKLTRILPVKLRKDLRSFMFRR